MNELLNSKLATDLKEGKLPQVDVEVTMATSSMLMIGVIILIVGTVLIAGSKLIK